ncbi:hypothetical protein QTP86_012850 [Hemibagrus guttatus]|nr:hypothetical protein QTP86_012850 [Hemibagrus guttatus]
MPRKSTTDAIFALRILMEKCRDGQRELHCVFVDLEKAYDRMPREELWYCMRKSGVADKYVRVVQDMYERSRTVVRCAVGQTEEFNVEVGLHQGSALSPFLFAIVMDQLSEEVRQESPWTMMFADDIVICSESREQVEENLERWRFALERRGMKVSRSKTEYMCVNEREGSGTVRLQGERVKKVQEFKYLGSTVQSNGECGKEVKKRVQAGWNGWRKVSGVLCDRKISARIKEKVDRTVVRPAMLYGLETVSLRKRQESELEVAELKMLRVLEGSWEFAQPVHMCFVDMEKAFNNVPCGILWEVLWEYGVQGVSTAPLSQDLQHALGRFAAEFKVAGMSINPSKSQAMVLDRKKAFSVIPSVSSSPVGVIVSRLLHVCLPLLYVTEDRTDTVRTAKMSNPDPVQDLVDALRRTLTSTSTPAPPATTSAFTAASPSPSAVASPMAKPAPFTGLAEDCNGFLL